MSAVIGRDPRHQRPSRPAKSGTGAKGRHRRIRTGIAFGIMLSAALMFNIDLTVVNIALPNIQAALRFSATSLSWVDNGYTLAFGGLLLLGGRAGDILGRRRVFLAGIVTFTLASLVGGLANSAAVLLTARVIQGIGSALASPAVLALVISGFAEGKERTRALAVYSAVATGGGTLGLVLGGVINQYASWRWVLFVNVPVGVVVTAFAPMFVAETPRQPGRFDLPGAVTSIAGVAALAYAFIRAASNGWGDHLGIAAFAAGGVLLVAFVRNEARAPQPVTPLRLFADMGRSGSLAVRLLIAAGVFGLYFFLVQFLQEVRGLSALTTGIAFLPNTVMLFMMSRLAPWLIRRVGGYRLLLIGLIPMIIGMAWLARLSPTTGYWPGVFGPMALIGGGSGAAVVPLTAASLAGVRPEDSGAASSLVNVFQQLSGSVGLATLVAAFTAGSRDPAAHPVAGLPTAAQHASVLAHGIAAAFGLAAIFNVAAFVVAAALLRPRKLRLPGRHRR